MIRILLSVFYCLWRRITVKPYREHDSIVQYIIMKLFVRKVQHLSSCCSAYTASFSAETASNRWNTQLMACSQRLGRLGPTWLLFMVFFPSYIYISVWSASSLLSDSFSDRLDWSDVQLQKEKRGVIVMRHLPKLVAIPKELELHLSRGG